MIWSHLGSGALAVLGQVLGLTATLGNSTVFGNQPDNCYPFG